MVMESILDWSYDFLFAPNITKRFLAVHPSIPIAIIIAYIVICLHYGEVFMKHRKPFNIKPIIILYDIFQVIVNGYLFTKMAPVHFTLDWSFHCPNDWMELFKTVIEKEGIVLWHSFLIRFLDLLDTMFFILRKKQCHVSLLHVVHHVFAAGTSCYLLSFDNKPLFILVVLTMNTFVHTIMYAYYGLATIGFTLPRFKKAVTTVQIVQFILAVTYMSTLCVSGCFDLNIPNLIIMSMVIFFLIMFVDFYISNFLRKNQ